MKINSKPITILMADDDPDDRLLVQEAFDCSSDGAAYVRVTDR